MTDLDSRITCGELDGVVGRDLFALVRRSTAWLDAANGTSVEEQRLRILKVMEEAGEVAAAVIGATGQNPRKGRTHDTDDIVRELVDVAVTALVAVQSVAAVDAAVAVGSAVARVAGRLDGMGVPRGVPVADVREPHP